MEKLFSPTFFGWSFIIREEGGICDAHCLLQYGKVKVEQIFQNGKIVQGDLAYRPLYFPTDFTCPAVCVFVIDQKIGQKGVPEIAVKAVAFRQFDQIVQAAVILRGHVLFFRGIWGVVADEPCDAAEYVVTAKILV